jgi:hypothetical protein
MVVKAKTNVLIPIYESRHSFSLASLGVPEITTCELFLCTNGISSSRHRTKLLCWPLPPQLAVHHGTFPIDDDTIVCAIHLRRISRVWQSLYIHARRIDDGIRSLSVEIVGAAAPAATVTVGFGVGATTGGASEATAAY